MKLDYQCPLCSHRFDLTAWLIDATEDDFRLADLPNTLTGLKDHNVAEFRCPNCKQWITNEDEECAI